MIPIMLPLALALALALDPQVAGWYRILMDKAATGLAMVAPLV
jgi:hypothetical protein